MYPMRFANVAMAVLVLTFISAWPSLAEKRVALVIGNGAYENVAQLPNPPNDAEDVSAALKRVGFEVIAGRDLDKRRMDDVTIRFSREVRNADIALFYYSGHAMQFAGVNYLVPVDAKITDEADLRRLTRVDEIVADLQQAKNVRILVLDSCRDNPLANDLKRSIGLTRAASVQRGLARIDAPLGMIVAFATQAGGTAEDGTGRNSPYTASFLTHIDEQDEVGTVFRRISSDVYRTTNQKQLPELSLSLTGEFYLRGRLEVSVGAPGATAPPPPVDPCGLAGEHWRSAEKIGTIAAFEDHIARFPNCVYAGLAKAQLEALKNKQANISPEPAPVITRGRDDGWLASAEYQKLFNAMVAQRRYPRVVEARAIGNHIMFRGEFAPYPNPNFGFYSAHGVTSDEFQRRDRAYRAQGFKLLHRQSVTVGGVELVQATWVHNN